MYKKRKKEEATHRCSKLNLYCLLSCRDNSTPIFFAFADPLWPCIKVRVIKTNMSIYAMHKSTVMPSLNAIVREIAIIFQVKHLSNLRRIYDLEWTLRSLNWERNIHIIYSPWVGLSTQQTWWALFVNSFWNNRTFIILMIKISVTLNKGQDRYN